MLPTLETQEQDFHLLSNVLSMNGEFRPDPLVLLRLGRAFYEKGSLKRSHLHFVSRTTWPYVKKYLNLFQENNHIMYNKNDKSYKPTETGWKMFGLVLSLYDHPDFKKQSR